MKWTKEKALGILIRKAKTRDQVEYSLGRAQLGIIGYTVEEFHKEFCSKYSDGELEEFSREYEKAAEEVMIEYNKAQREATRTCCKDKD